MTLLLLLWMLGIRNAQNKCCTIMNGGAAALVMNRSESKEEEIPESFEIRDEFIDNEN